MGTAVPLSGEVWMPWKECSVVDERLRFVAQLLDGEAMSEVWRASPPQDPYSLRYRPQVLVASPTPWRWRADGLR
jgi:hypothetical protein